MDINIPGRNTLVVKHLVLDFNGTIAQDGVIIDGVRERIVEIANWLNVYVVTADTNGSVNQESEGLPLKVSIIGKENQLNEKKRFIQGLGSEGVIAIGNGVNDEWMFEEANLAIAVVGHEGCAFSSMMKSDIVVNHINDGLDLILKQNRLIATLRM